MYPEEFREQLLAEQIELTDPNGPIPYVLSAVSRME